MRVFSWFFFLLVLGLVGFLAYKVKSGAQGDPDLLVAEAQRLVGGAEPDLPAAIDRLNFALRIAQGDPVANHERIGSILAMRGALFADTKMGQYAQARIDLERVLKNYRPGDPDVQLDLAAVLLTTDEKRAALDLTQSVLGIDPRRADAWTLQARALIGLADEILAAAREVCAEAMAERDEVRAHEVLDRITSLEIGSPERVNYLFKLRELFGMRDEGRLRDVLRLADQASEYVTEARTALAESFRDQPTRDSLHDFLSMLRRAGRRDLAVDFGLAAINRRAANSNVLFVGAMLEDLLSTDRPHTGVDIINQYYARSSLPSPEFYRFWTEALYRDQRWQPLVFVAQSMRNSASTDHQKAAGNLYLGLAHYRLEQYFEAPNPLTHFTASGTLDPFPGARVTAYLALAHCYRQLDQANLEKAALRGALRDMPDDHPDAAEAWLRLSEIVLASEPTSTKEAFEALTHGVRLSPERVDELMPAWRGLGERMLSESRANLTLTYQTLVASGQLVPEGPVEPYELVRLAEMYAEDDNSPGTAGCARKFLLRYPGFLPMLDAYLATARRMNDPELLARLLIERVERAGPDPATIAEIGALPTGLMTLETRTRLMRLDPEHTGRLALVRDLRSKGRALEALAGLNLVPADQLNDEGKLLQAMLAHELGRWGLAEQALASIPTDSPHYGHALELRLDIAVATSTRKPLEGLIEEVTARSEPNVEFLLGTADRMMLAGLSNYARLLLQKLDQREETRDGAVMFRRALATWLCSEAQDAEDHIARAQAYQTDGGPELGWLIRAVDQRRWNDLPWLVADLQATHFKPTLLQSAILDLLREELGAAEELVERALRQQPEEALWTVLRRALDLMQSRYGPEPGASPPSEDELVFLLVGQGGGDRDPRQLLVRLLAMDHPGWLVWATAEFESDRIPPQGASWSKYLAGRCWERLGNLERAEASTREILETWADFVPAWDLLERVTLAGVSRPDHPRYVRVQLSRRRNFGERGDLQPVDLRTAARAKVDEDDLESAVALLEEAREMAPDDIETLLYLAQLRHRRLEWTAAIQTYSEVIARHDAEQGDYVVEEFLQVLEEAVLAQPDLRARAQEQVENLTLRFPADPRVALSRARRELEGGSSIPEIRLSRAFKRLDEFRVATEYRRLEDLAPGSTRPWVEFYLQHDPLAAHALIQAELDKEPASLDHWQMLGESFAAIGKRAEAIEVFEFIQRMLPDARTTRTLAHLLSQTGRDTERVSALTNQTIHLERTRSRDIDLQLAIARSFVNNLAVNARDRGIEILQDLWAKRSRARDSSQVAQIGELYGLALSWRADTKDRRTAYEVLTEVDALIEDPARRHMLRAVANMALTMSRQQ